MVHFSETSSHNTNAQFNPLFHSFKMTLQPNKNIFEIQDIGIGQWQATDGFDPTMLRSLVQCSITCAPAVGQARSFKAKAGSNFFTGQDQHSDEGSDGLATSKTFSRRHRRSAEIS
jgi:hypothetical protein